MCLFIIQVTYIFNYLISNKHNLYKKELKKIQNKHSKLVIGIKTMNFLKVSHMILIKTVMKCFSHVKINTFISFTHYLMNKIYF